MVNSNTNALGIFFPNSYNFLVPDLVSERLTVPIPFVSRHRLVDFILSSTANCGVDNIFLTVHRNYHSPMDHLGSSREQDLTRKSSGFNLVPPYAEKAVSIYNSRVEALAGILDFLKEQKEKYVAMVDANLAANFDFGTLIETHTASHADVTVAYKEELLPIDLIEHRDIGRNLYYALAVDNGRVTKMYMNSSEPGIRNISMSVYITDREPSISQMNTVYVCGQVCFERDILVPQLKRPNVRAFCYDGCVARIGSMKSYFNENMKILDDVNMDALFSAGNPIYTKTRDGNLTRYISGSKVSNIMAADGRIIEGEVENSILLRSAKVGKGAWIRNCVLVQDTVIEVDAGMKCVMTDKNMTTTRGKTIKGTVTFPVYVAKYQVV